MTVSKINDLALFGGLKIIQKPFKKYNSIGLEEKKAAIEVIESGVLSQFVGVWGEDFYGGKKVQAFEKECQTFFEVKHAITVNSWTSGLMAAVGAIDIQPGDEVIVSPWTMCASATAILNWNAIPVFADIEEDTFCLDPSSVEKNISKYTKAIMSIDIAGQSADMDALTKIAKKYNLKIISDAAQSPGALYKGKFTGTLGDVGGFSLNYHKHIHTGEGGVLVTNDDDIAERLNLIRNHAEAVVLDKGVTNISNMIGYNFRLGEIEASIGSAQLKKLKQITEQRQAMAERLNFGLGSLKGLQIPVVRDQCSHVYYLYQMKLDIKIIGTKRNILLKALQAEGLEGLSINYTNIHLLPMYQNKIAYGSNGFPWTSDICNREINYKKGICPIAENLQDNIYLGFAMCMHELDNTEIDLIIKCFHKVWNNLEKLKEF